MNDSLKEMLDLVLAQHDALSTRLDDVTEPAEARAVITEMQELLRRADLVQNLLLIATTKRLEGAIERVRAADQDLTQQLKQLAHANQSIKAMTTFLKYVDKAIDLAQQAAKVAAAG